MKTHEQFRASPFDRERFVQTNRDLAERMDREGVIVIYDDVLDTLFIDVGAHTDGALEPVADNVMVRIDPTTYLVLGYEVEDFRRDFLPNNRIVQEWANELRLFERPNQAIQASESTQEATLRRLMAVA